MVRHLSNTKIVATHIIFLGTLITLTITGLLNWNYKLSGPVINKNIQNIESESNKTTRPLPINKNIQQIDDKFNMTTRPLLTLFTVFDLSNKKPYKNFAHRAVIKNWATFMPAIQPVLFHYGKGHPLVMQASDAKWDLLRFTSFNKFGTPKLKPMFSKIFDTYNSSFYGFANGDILFSQSLSHTLKKIEAKLERLYNNVLVVGQRTNFNINLNESDAIYNISNIDTLGRAAYLFRTDAIDYFFFSSGNSLNWTALADVVIGRPGYDNYLVSKSLKSGVNVIDATTTLLALHISAPDVIAEGAKNPDGLYNKQVIGMFRYWKGQTSKTKMRTAYDAFREVVVINR